MKNVKVGFVYKNLTVVSEAGRSADGSKLWNCQCSCGGSSLLSSTRVGKVKSCGCLRNSCRTVKNGDRFGRLVAVRPAGRIDTGREGAHLFLFKCDCGTEKVIRVGNAKSGKTKSCGCLQKEAAKTYVKPNRRGYGDSSLLYLHSRIRRKARIRGKDFCLKETDMQRFVDKPCIYCGSLPPLIKLKGGYGEVRCHGLDRIDSSVGYVVENVAPACYECNVVKSTKSVSEFKKWTERVHHLCSRRSEF